MRGKTVIGIGKLVVKPSPGADDARDRASRRVSSFGRKSLLGEVYGKVRDSDRFAVTSDNSSSKTTTVSPPRKPDMGLSAPIPALVRPSMPTLVDQSAETDLVSGLNEITQQASEAPRISSLDTVDLARQCRLCLAAIQSQHNRIRQSLSCYSFYDNIDEALIEVDTQEKIVKLCHEYISAAQDRIRNESEAETKQTLHSMLHILRPVQDSLKSADDIAMAVTSVNSRLFHTLYYNPYHEDSDQEASAEEDYVATLRNFQLVRGASTAIHHHLKELSHTCKAHTIHRIYLDLEAESYIHEDLQSVHFRLAFGSEISHSQMMWFEAQSEIRLPVNGTMVASQFKRRGVNSLGGDRRDVTSVMQAALKPRKESGGRISKRRQRQMVKAAPERWNLFFAEAEDCMQRLKVRCGLDLSFSPQTRNRLLYDKPFIPADGEPIRLSEFIAHNPYMGILTRLRLAKAIAEGVLKFDPSVWLPSRLISQDMIVICSLDGQGYEPHFNIRLAGPDGQGDMPRPSHQKCGQPCEEVLRKLYMTLLELAGGASDEELEDEGDLGLGRSARTRSGPRLTDLGAFYTDAVRYCKSLSRDPRCIYDPEVQMDFYQNVVCALESAENCQSEMRKRIPLKQPK
ncbi:hypothetical protein DL771_002058 [Monosporascus sp. 5C6A]|nr:hypothetical protein DL771_002058 [Monosporascus sp. 5C6A]